MRIKIINLVCKEMINYAIINPYLPKNNVSNFLLVLSVFWVLKLLIRKKKHGCLPKMASRDVWIGVPDENLSTSGTLMSTFRDAMCSANNCVKASVSIYIVKFWICQIVRMNIFVFKKNIFLTLLLKSDFKF